MIDQEPSEGSRPSHLIPKAPSVLHPSGPLPQILAVLRSLSAINFQNNSPSHFLQGLKRSWFPGKLNPSSHQKVGYLEAGVEPGILDPWLLPWVSMPSISNKQEYEGVRDSTDSWWCRACSSPAWGQGPSPEKWAPARRKHGILVLCSVPAPTAFTQPLVTSHLGRDFFPFGCFF